MSFISKALSVAGIAIDAYGRWKEGQDAKDVYKYNQAIAQYQADYIREAADLEIEALDRDVAEYVSRQRALQGKSGTVANTGSNLATIEQTYKERDIDAGLIRWRANKEADLVERGANLLGTQASQFSTAGWINAGTTLLGGLSKWDWKSPTRSARYASPPVPAFSGYTPSR